jgi:diadenosine tetraphosphatase ApaH/serine/threonine PP2A family protein phosphatase
MKMADLAGARPGDVLAFGHTHLPWYAEVQGVHCVNTGSVGRPKDGDWRAGYVMLDVEDGCVGAQVIRVEYDVDRAARAILASELPHDFAMFLRTGGRLPAATTEGGSPS